LDRDGLADVFMAVQELDQVHVHLGSTLSGAVDAATPWLRILGTGWATAGGGGTDLDADGALDLLVGMAEAGDGGGQVAWFCGPFSGGILVASTASCGSMTGDSQGTGELLGISAEIIGDVTGDGIEDVLAGTIGQGSYLLHHDDWVIGCPGCGADGRDSGLLVIVHGPASPGNFSPGDADGIALGLGPGHRVGEVLLAPGDLSGDGVPDLLLGVPNDATGGVGAGSVRFLTTW
jgi:hypothetical protein